MSLPTDPLPPIARKNGGILPRLHHDAGDTIRPQPGYEFYHIDGEFCR